MGESHWGPSSRGQSAYRHKRPDTPDYTQRPESTLQCVLVFTDRIERPICFHNRAVLMGLNGKVYMGPSKIEIFVHFLNVDRE